MKRSDRPRARTCIVTWLTCLMLVVCLADSAVADATNRVVNGTFETADPADARRPLGWDLPDGLGVQWRANEGRPGRAIFLDTRRSEVEMMASWTAAGLTNEWFIPKAARNPVAETYGLSYYSVPFAIVSGVTYRVRCEVWGNGGMKLWVRGYGTFRGRHTRRYEAVMPCEGRSGCWTTNEMVFQPTRHRPEVTEMKVMLFAYYPPGLYGFDNIVVEPALSDPPERSSISHACPSPPGAVKSPPIPVRRALYVGQ